MKALAVLAFMLGCIALLFSTEQQDLSREKALERAVALNYAVFREAALHHALAVKPVGEIPHTALNLPHGWMPVRNWQAKVTGKTCLIWGSASAGEITAVRELFRGSLAVGCAQAGQLVPGFGAVVPVPGIPDGSLVSVVNLE